MQEQQDHRENHENEIPSDPTNSGLTEISRDNSEDSGALAESNSVSPAAKIASVFILIILSITDFAIEILLRTRTNERTIQPTKRRSYPPGTKETLFRRQNHQCIICGKRRLIKNLQIDHIFPVVRGGPDNISNYQLLCPPCNQRKGIQSNQEFYDRYRRIASTNMLKSPPAPPRAEISQKAFRDETARTTAHANVQHFRSTKYISAKTKIQGGSIGIGIALGAVWLFGLLLTFPDSGEIVANIALFGGIILGLAVCVGVIWRAKHTGKYDQ